MIALSWPAGAGADGTATLVNITSQRLNVPNVTSAPQRIKLIQNPNSNVFFFLPASILLAGSKYVSWIHLTSSRFVLTLGFKQTGLYRHHGQNCFFKLPGSFKRRKWSFRIILSIIVHPVRFLKRIRWGN